MANDGKLTTQIFKDPKGNSMTRTWHRDGTMTVVPTDPSQIRPARRSLLYKPTTERKKKPFVEGLDIEKMLEEVKGENV